MIATLSPVAPRAGIEPEPALRLLSEGEVLVQGLVPWGSNATFLVTLRCPDQETLAIYKPQRGESPLWDFDRGTLAGREVAAYRLCEALGWHFVPPTVLREGPYGPGSVQLFIRAQEGAHFFTMRDDPAYDEDLRRLAAFDVLANNADRKSGHCLLDASGRLWAIDNALTFHVEPKLRTVIWDYAGEALPAEMIACLRALLVRLGTRAGLSEALGDLLDGDEMAALRRRLRGLLRAGRFPEPGPGRAIPWPLV